MRVVRLLLLILWLAVPAAYFFFSTVFLNKLNKRGVLFPPNRHNTNFIYFTSDIFDMFWLIVGAVPNALFAGSFFAKTWDSLSWDFTWKVLILCLMPIGVATVIWYSFVAPATKEFSESEAVWSYKLPDNIQKIYSGFELVSIVVFSSEVVCTIFSIYQFITTCDYAAMGTLPTYALIASIIMLLYWIMLVLSNISNMKISEGIAGKPGIFPEYYGAIGSIALFVVTICTYLFWKVPPCLRPNFTPIISTILLPGAAIVLQILKIRPKKEDS